MVSDGDESGPEDDDDDDDDAVASEPQPDTSKSRAKIKLAFKPKKGAKGLINVLNFSLLLIS